MTSSDSWPSRIRIGFTETPSLCSVSAYDVPRLFNFPGYGHAPASMPYLRRLAVAAFPCVGCDSRWSPRPEQEIPVSFSRLSFKHWRRCCAARAGTSTDCPLLWAKTRPAPKGQSIAGRSYGCGNGPTTFHVSVGLCRFRLYLFHPIAPNPVPNRHILAGSGVTSGWY